MPPSKIAYLTIPATSPLLSGGADGFSSRFRLDPRIPLPVEVAAGQTRQDALESLTLEMLLSGMIKTLTGDPSCRYQNYYRRFVRACKPGLLRELCQAALVKVENADYDFACEIAAALRALYPKSARALHTRAVVLDEHARYLREAGNEPAAAGAEERAEKAYREALSLAEPLTSTLLSAGFFYYRLQNYGRARELFRLYIPLADDDENKEQARACLGAIEIGHLDDAQFAEASQLIQNGHLAEGLQKIRAFLAGNEQVWNAHFLLGLGLRLSGSWQDALAAFKRARELGGNIPETANESALCLMELGRVDEAKKELEAALRADDENIKILSNLALVELKLGNKETALQFFRTVLEYAPDDPIAKRFLEV